MHRIILFLNKYPTVKVGFKWVYESIRCISATYRSRKKINDELSLLMPDSICIDIGASYYPHPAWEIFRSSSKTKWIAVEPNKQNLTYITNWVWPSKVQTVETGLSQSGGKQILYVTNVDSGSSLLEPVVNDNMKHRVGDLSYFFPVTKKEINTITLQNVIDMHNIQPNIPIGIKLDTQGTEFSILQGLDSKILKENVICVEIENTLLAKPFMNGSAKFQNVLAFFEENEFELVAFNPIKCNSPLVNPKLNSSSVLNECDAVFLLRHDIIKKRPLEFQTTMLGYYVSYKLYGEAFELLKYITLNNKSNPELCKSCNLLMEHFH